MLIVGGSIAAGGGGVSTMVCVAGVFAGSADVAGGSADVAVAGSSADVRGTADVASGRRACDTLPQPLRTTIVVKTSSGSTNLRTTSMERSNDAPPV
ncbi:MAG: hypothetical protein DMD81_11130 [Candidatus Rokuibacteriota bacterium]|nr:MAG: hypothetical protein DMD81_11130 [Candidatus Rokubacteria bacterium]